jgi:hypothetical protein
MSRGGGEDGLCVWAVGEEISGRGALIRGRKAVADSKADKNVCPTEDGQEWPEADENGCPTRSIGFGFVGGAGAAVVDRVDDGLDFIGGEFFLAGGDDEGFADGAADGGGREELSIDDDGEAVVDVVGGDFFEFFAACVGEVDAYGGLADGAVGAGDVAAVEEDGF